MRNPLLYLLLLAGPMASANSIKETYADYFPTGMAITTSKVRDGNPALHKFIADNFEVLTAENAFKWDHIHPQEDRYDFKRADEIADYARKNGLKLWGHTLVWYRQTPDWVFMDNGKPASRELVLQRMQDHIQTVMARYKDIIYGWDVVNEALSDDKNKFLRESDWLKHVGDDYIEMAFKYARKAEPGALLCYNDYSLADPPKRKKLERLLKDLMAKKAGPDVVGFQSHYDISYPPVEFVEESLQMVAGLGLKVAISELDLSVFDYSNKSRKLEGGFTTQMELHQGLRFAELMDLYRRWSNTIERITFWDVFDATNWRNNEPIAGREDHAGLIDRSNRPKAAFLAVLNPRIYLKTFSHLKESQGKRERSP